ncbi:LysM peptidoglycan-binding domain-containing protein [Sporosarcina sp. Marseille-Q4063]|uniref:LysM peptidoglycan-binding domain-containing protein n=1 Tax=Sporosarcina sp. Marseille-Q4063 TaxID=2810514 RepID=UPI001BAF8C5D|nr:LysM peptidoglycan-binding domain-containing protein [Sporosarcina sp. Marseille-Q4063]QUW22425.1 LysM peptidoglycan-binding domain-containing protein [Sporosarcina sp. Marseille-Q4063]
MQYFYTVRHNETLKDIAKRWRVPVASIIASNNLQAPYTISVGEQLSIPPGVNEYHVQSGDSVYWIAQLFGLPISVIVEANKLTPPYLLHVNQVLKIPPGVPFYVVQRGDTLYKIAQRYNVLTENRINTDAIQKLNKLPDATISPGMKLKIPYVPPGGSGFIAYTSNQGGQFDIWTYNLRNGETKQLTSGLGDTFSIPMWSPDSSRIAFVGKDRVVYVIYLTSGSIGAIDQLAEGGDFSLDWSPDSVHLAYAARGIIQVYNTTLHAGTIVEQPGASDVNWFPNGEELLFQALDTSGVSQLYRCRIIGNEKEQITNNENGLLQNVQLSPDGTFVLYTTPGASISIINTIELATGKVYEVKGGPQAKNYYPKWSPDSLKIAYSATDLANNSYFSQIRSVKRKGADDRIWAISNCFSTPVTWSPDGSDLAYLSGCSAAEFSKEMWVIDLKRLVPIQLLKGFTIMSLNWSPEPVLDLAKKDYTNESFGVNFQYPASWKKINDERYVGDDGFFQVSAIFGSENIDDICHDEAFHELNPYGTTPKIITSENPYIEACTILPSSDQPAEMNKQAAYIVKYPEPIQLDGNTYNYFVLWADKNHIDTISFTLLFLP